MLGLFWAHNYGQQGLSRRSLNKPMANLSSGPDRTTPRLALHHIGHPVFPHYCHPLFFIDKFVLLYLDNNAFFLFAPLKFVPATFSHAFLSCPAWPATSENYLLVVSNPSYNATRTSNSDHRRRDCFQPAVFYGRTQSVFVADMASEK
jgi:hypothetical protein